MKINRLLCVATFLITCAITKASLASDQVGTVTELQGSAKLFTSPSKTVQDNAAGPRALFEGEYFVVKDVKVGDRVEQDNILRTSPGSKIRVIYENGDQFTVGPSTIYRIHWDKDSRDAATSLKLTQGYVRAIVAKNGPRSRFTIRTRAATMGVRGTDFLVASPGSGTRTELSVLRGKVSIASDAPDAKGEAIEAGHSAEVALAGKKVEVGTLAQQDIAFIQKATRIVPPIEPLSPEIKTRVADLEKKAIATTLEDIKTASPATFAKLQGQSFSVLGDLDQHVTAVMSQEAPKTRANLKFKDELDGLEKGGYENYFTPGSEPSAAPDTRH